MFSGRSSARPVPRPAARSPPPQTSINPVFWSDQGRPKGLGDRPGPSSKGGLNPFSAMYSVFWILTDSRRKDFDEETKKSPTDVKKRAQPISNKLKERAGHLIENIKNRAKKVKGEKGKVNVIRLDFLRGAKSYSHLFCCNSVNLN